MFTTGNTLTNLIGEYAKSPIMLVGDVPNNISSEKWKKMLFEFIKRGLSINYVCEKNTISFFVNVITAECASTAYSIGIQVVSPAKNIQLSEKLKTTLETKRYVIEPYITYDKFNKNSSIRIPSHINWFDIKII